MESKEHNGGFTPNGPEILLIQMTCTLITQHSTSGGIKIASGFKPAWTKELDVRGKINFLKHKVSFELKKIQNHIFMFLLQNSFEK